MPNVGVVGKAQEVLEGLPTRNVVSWSTVIVGYAQQGQCHEALNCLKRMQSEGLSPNTVTFISILKACMNTGAINKGKQIHDESVQRGLLEEDIVLGTTLVDMYARCGMLTKSPRCAGRPTYQRCSFSLALFIGYMPEMVKREAWTICFQSNCATR